MTTRKPLVLVGGIEAELPSGDTINDEGTFTPSLLFGGNAVGMTGSVFLGRYVKMGSRVFFDVRVVLTAKGSSTGAATIAGLPFSASGTPAGLFPTGCAYALNMTTVAMPVWFISGTAISLYDFTGSTAIGMSHSDFTDTSSVSITGSYSV